MMCRTAAIASLSADTPCHRMATELLCGSIGNSPYPFVYFSHPTSSHPQRRPATRKANRKRDGP